METGNKSIQTRKTPIVYVDGSHRQMGQQIGEAFTEQINHSIENAHILINDAYEDLQITWESAQVQARKYLPFAEERYPQYIDELRGIAEGAKVSFADISVLNAMEAVTVDALHLTKCTSMAVNQERTTNGHVYVAHNEDWLPEDEPDVFIIHAKPDDEPPFIAMTYGGLLPNIGFNAYGIAQCCDSVYCNDSRIGIPRLVLSRAVMAARTPSEAIRHMLVSHRAAGYNHLLAHEDGELYNVEVSARRFGILYAEDNFIVHSNHYIDDKMREMEDEPDELISSRVRYFRALRLLKQTPQHTVKTLQTILKDHLNFPDSICNHSVIGDPLDREKTICSIVMDLTNRQLLTAWGTPCENGYWTYQLDG